VGIIDELSVSVSRYVCDEFDVEDSLNSLSLCRCALFCSLINCNAFYTDDNDNVVGYYYYPAGDVAVVKYEFTLNDCDDDDDG